MSDVHVCPLLLKLVGDESLKISHVAVSCGRLTAWHLCTRQECFKSEVDSECIPAPEAQGQELKSFPMDALHGFGVAHDKVR